MRWTPGGRSQDLEDRRGGGGFGGGFIPGGGRGLGLGGLIVLLVLSFIFKRDFLGLLGGADAPAGASSGEVASSPEEEKLVGFVSFVLDDAQQTWDRLLASRGTPYRHAKLVLFRDAIQSPCGFAEAATGPFYCPGDEKVYIDLGFYDELQRRFGAPGRLRAGLRPGPRDRPSYPTDIGNRGAGARGAAPPARPRQPAVGPSRAAGRLLRRHLGQLDRLPRQPWSKVTRRKR